MGGVVTEEQAITHAQYLDFIYLQSGTIYDIIPHSPHPQYCGSTRKELVNITYIVSQKIVRPGVILLHRL